VAGWAALAGLSGCATTQTLSSRKKLQSTRFLADRRPVLVTAPNPAVRVVRVALVRHGHKAAVVAQLRNTSRATMTDLPISVGLVSGHHRVWLNRRAGIGYFANHVAALAPGRDATWVFTTRKPVPAHGRPVAVVGSPVRPAISHATALPQVQVAGTPRAGSVRLHVSNPSGVPQYGLQVYAYARRGTRYVAAGRLTVAHLGTGESKDLRLALIGSARGTAVSLEALPTIFQ
jgi:hypothetical protein